MLGGGPLTLAELVERRLMYPPGHADLWVDCAEARAIGMHLDELLADDRVRRDADGRFALARR